MPKIYAPNTAFSGETVGVVFKDGVGDLDPKANPAALAYFERRGFGIGRKAATPEAEPLADPREMTHQVVGTSLRDAAVDPQPEDFLAPINAGEANPHGPEVVSPEIHASGGPPGLRPGEVHVDDTSEQEKDEQQLATEILIENVPVGEATGSFDPDNADMGPLGLSDPGSVEMGVRAAAEAASAAEDAGTEATPTSLTMPAKNAKQAAWAEYAIARGMPADEANAATRAVLVKRYGKA